MKTFILLFILLNTVISAQYSDTIDTKPVQYRRGIPLQEGYQTYSEKYTGKNLIEEQRRLFPLQSTGMWTELNPKVPRVDYIGIHFVNKDTGWAVGDLGAIIKTTNGGEDWTISETSVNNLLLKVHSYDGQLVIATGYNGMILRSSDRGETFEQIVSGVGSGIDLWGVQMVNDTLGFVCGLNQTLLKTTDTGLSWQPVNAGLNSHYWALNFLNEEYGVISCGGGKVLRTTDGGNSWTQIQAGDARSLYTINIIDSLHIAAAGEWGNEIQYEGGKNVYSNDAGVTWMQNPDMPTYTDANWVEFLDTDTGYAITVDQGIYKTTDRGQNWFSVGGGGEWQLDLTEDGIGYSGGEGLNIFKRTNGLENWSIIFLNVNWSDGFFINETKGFLISADVGEGIYKTEDGGISFQKIENSPIGYDLFFLDSLTGFVAGKYKTNDGGESWYQVNTGGGIKVFFINDSVGWSIDSHIYKTTDTGENWLTQLFAPVGVSFFGIHFADSLYGWAADVGARPYKTPDGGINWIEQTNLNIWDTRDVFFIDQQNGFLMGFNELYRTTDGGNSLILNPKITGFGIAEFSTFEDSTIFIIGGRTFRSLDRGENWNEFPELDGIILTGLSLLNSGLGFAVGSGGLIMKYYDTTYVPVELTAFEAHMTNNEIVLEWVTASELNNYGFEVQRSFNKTNWERIGFVPGKGTSTEISYYSFSNSIISTERIYYRLKQIDYNGAYEYSEVIEVEILTPKEFSLNQNYPNPFNNSTVITFQIPTDEIATLKLFDVLGNEVKTLINGNIKAGHYSITFSADNLSSGIYFYKLTAGEQNLTKKIMLLK